MKNILKIAFTLLLTLFISCNNEFEQDEIKANEDKTIVAYFEGKPYTITEINNIAVDLSEDKLNSKLLEVGVIKKSIVSDGSDLYKMLNINKSTIVTEYEINNGKIYYEYKNDKNESIIIKAENLNGEISFLDKYTYDMFNSKKTILVEKNTNKSSDNVYSRRGWCQQENGETASACNDREYDEFTSDWVGFIAYWSNPPIPILIAAMCAC
jgi:hypothetical protein